MKWFFKILLAMMIVFSTSTLFAQYMPQFLQQVGYTEWYFDELGRNVVFDVGITNPSHVSYGYFASYIIPIEFMIMVPVHEVVELAWFGYFFNRPNQETYGDAYDFANGIYKKSVGGQTAELEVINWDLIRNSLTMFVGLTHIDGLSLGFYLGGGLEYRIKKLTDKDGFLRSSVDYDYTEETLNGWAFVETGFGMFANNSFWEWNDLDWISLEQVAVIKFLGEGDAFGLGGNQTDSTKFVREGEILNYSTFQWMSIFYKAYFEMCIKIVDMIDYEVFGDVARFDLRPTFNFEFTTFIPLKLIENSNVANIVDGNSVEERSYSYSGIDLMIRPALELDIRPVSAQRFRARYRIGYQGVHYTIGTNYWNKVGADWVEETSEIQSHNNRLLHEVRLRYLVKFPKVMSIDSQVLWNIQQEWVQKVTLDSDGAMRQNLVTASLLQTISAKLRFGFDLGALRFRISWLPGFNIYTTADAGTVVDSNFLNLANWDAIVSFSFAP